MQLKTIALAAAFAVTSTLAFAQAGGNDAGAAVSEHSGTAVNGGGGAVKARHDRMTNRTPRTTTGMSTGRSGPGLRAGRPDESRPGGQGVSRKPPS